MFFKRKCGKSNGLSVGGILVSIGVGLMLAYIIPYYLLITILGVGLICAGIYFIRKC